MLWCRDVVRPSYNLLVRAMFQTIERLASTDAKHGDRLRLESYAYFVTNIAEPAGAEPVLSLHVRQALAAKQKAMQAYVQQQLEHGKFWKLLEFSMVGKQGLHPQLYSRMCEDRNTVLSWFLPAGSCCDCLVALPSCRVWIWTLGSLYHIYWCRQSHQDATVACIRPFPTCMWVP